MLYFNIWYVLLLKIARRVLHKKRDVTELGFISWSLWLTSILLPFYHFWSIIKCYFSIGVENIEAILMIIIGTIGYYVYEYKKKYLDIEQKVDNVLTKYQRDRLFGIYFLFYFIIFSLLIAIAWHVSFPCRVGNVYSGLL